jgi:6-phosphogluconate dehydrogenase
MAASFGVIGLGVMGRNLALNVEDHGFPVAVWNLESDWTDKFLDENRGRKLTGARTLAELAAAVARPRRILIMIKAGPPVDSTLANLRPHLAPGDVVIDGGNSWFEDTRKREAALAKDKILLMGCGVSGGEDGARHGPCLMPGGAREAWTATRDVLTAIAATSDAGPCVTWVGADGAGHFVKMVHNGIEYGDMQLIAEAYDLLSRGLGLSVEELQSVFQKWNSGPLQSFLIELTATVFRVRDRDGAPLIDRVVDAAGQKGTGRWTAQVALDLGVAIPTIAAAIDARVMSSMRAERAVASQLLSGPGARWQGERAELLRAVEDALYASKVCSYAQGMSLIAAGSRQYGWTIDLAEMARIWKGGCIIRAKLLDDIRAAFGKRADLPNLLLDDHFRATVERAQPGWRRVVAAAAELGIPVPAMGASLNYFDSYRAARLPQNLTQAQRDAFGSHTYQRIDDPSGAFIHSDWIGEGSKK